MEFAFDVLHLSDESLFAELRSGNDEVEVTKDPFGYFVLHSPSALETSCTLHIVNKNELGGALPSEVIEKICYLLHANGKPVPGECEVFVEEATSELAPMEETLTLFTARTSGSGDSARYEMREGAVNDDGSEASLGERIAVVDLVKGEGHVLALCTVLDDRFKSEEESSRLMNHLFNQIGIVNHEEVSLLLSFGVDAGVCAIEQDRAFGLH